MGVLDILIDVLLHLEHLNNLCMVKGAMYNRISHCCDDNITPRPKIHCRYYQKNVNTSYVDNLQNITDFLNYYLCMSHTYRYTVGYLSYHGSNIKNIHPHIYSL